MTAKAEIEVYKPSEFQGELQGLEKLKDKKQALLKDSEGLVISDPKTYEGIRKSRTNIQRFITYVDDKRKFLNRENKKAVDGIAADLLEGMEARKEELIEKISAWDEARAKEKAEKERLEAERKKKIQDSILNFRLNTTKLITSPNKTSQELWGYHKELKAYVPDPEFYGESLPDMSLEVDLLIRQAETMAMAQEQREKEEYDRVKAEYFALFKQVILNGTPIEELRKAINEERARIQKIADEAQKKVEADKIGARADYKKVFGVEAPESYSLSEIYMSIDEAERKKADKQLPKEPATGEPRNFDQKERDQRAKLKEQPVQIKPDPKKPENPDYIVGVDLAKGEDHSVETQVERTPDEKIDDAKDSYLKDAEADREILSDYFSQVAEFVSDNAPEIALQDSEKVFNLFSSLVVDASNQALDQFDKIVKEA